MCTNVHDEVQSRRSNTQTHETAQHVDQERWSERGLVISALADKFPFAGCTSIHRTITEKLGYRKLCVRIPKMLTDNNTKGKEC